MRGQFGNNRSIGDSDRARLLILAGVVVTLLTAISGAVFFYSESSTAAVKTVVVEKEPEVKMADVLVPLQNIEAGQPLEPAMFRKESRPAIGLPSRVLKDFEEIKGQYARSLIVAEQPLHRDYITNIRPTNPLTMKIPDGYRAVTIAVDARSSVEGWARAGARVDVVWTSRLRGEPIITVIVQNAQILSAERQTDNGNGQQVAVGVPSTVTLLVTAADANKVQLAQNNGTLSLNLRGDNDPGKSDPSVGGSVSLDQLFSRNPQEPRPVVPTGPRIKMRSGDKVEEFVFQDGRLVPAPPL